LALLKELGIDTKSLRPKLLKSEHRRVRVTIREKVERILEAPSPESETDVRQQRELPSISLTTIRELDIVGTFGWRCSGYG
jgi:hypothetical protein